MSQDKTIYQKRYLDHQAKKAEILFEIMKSRHSDRMFKNNEVEEDKINKLVDVVELCPSSCDRKAIKVKVVKGRDEKALLGGLLVGGVGWVHRAPVVLLITADTTAYAGINEVDYMPYLDGGVVAQQLSLASTGLGLSGTFINPNIREYNKLHFTNVFFDGNKDIMLCGSYALGYPLKITDDK